MSQGKLPPHVYKERDGYFAIVRVKVEGDWESLRVRKMDRPEKAAQAHAAAMEFWETLKELHPRKRLRVMKEYLRGLTDWKIWLGPGVFILAPSVPGALARARVYGRCVLVAYDAGESVKMKREAVEAQIEKEIKR